MPEYDLAEFERIDLAKETGDIIDELGFAAVELVTTHATYRYHATRESDGIYLQPTSFVAKWFGQIVSGTVQGEPLRFPGNFISASHTVTKDEYIKKVMIHEPVVAV